MDATACTSFASHRRIARARAWLMARAPAEELLIIGANLDAAMPAGLWRCGRTTTTPSDHTTGSAISRPRLRQAQCSHNATGRTAAPRGGLRARPVEWAIGRLEKRTSRELAFVPAAVIGQYMASNLFLGDLASDHRNLA